ncbi:MAG TPA: hypothetical protein VFN06_05145 [Gaiellaceae bacterium]|nr:hypothetical protein [Gaiellaceae bacterium]
MRRDVGGAVRALVLPTIVLLGIALLAPGRLELAGRIYALVLCAAVIVVLLLALRRAFPDETTLREPAKRSPRRVPPPSLGRIEHETALAIAGTFDLHYHLVPRLRAVAAGLLNSRRNVSLTETPDAARAILGEDTWELVRPDRPPPADRLAKGIPPRELAQVVDALEGV